MYGSKIHYISLTGKIPSIHNLSDLFLYPYAFMNRFVTIDWVFILSTLILVPILFYVVYRFVIELGLDEKWGLLATTASFTLAQSLITYTPTSNLVFFWCSVTTQFMSSYFTRFPNIMASGIPFFIALTILHRQLKYPRSHFYLKYGMLSGIMTIMYFYLGVFLISMSFVYWLKSRDLDLLRASSIGMVVSIPAILLALTSDT